MNNIKKTSDTDKVPSYLAALGERIGHIAHLLGGKRALAQRLGIHESMLYRYIKGENALSAPLLLAIAEAGGVSLDWLAAGKGIAPATVLCEPALGAYGATQRVHAYTPVRNVDQGAPTLAFDAAWLTQLCGSSGDELSILEMRGDAMEPTLRAGDLLLIDGRVRRIAEDGLYALQLAQGTEIKRIQKQTAGNVLLSADNPRFQGITLARAAAQNLKLLGRVLWFGRRL